MTSRIRLGRRPWALLVTILLLRNRKLLVTCERWPGFWMCGLGSPFPPHSHIFRLLFVFHLVIILIVLSFFSLGLWRGFTFSFISLQSDFERLLFLFLRFCQMGRETASGGLHLPISCHSFFLPKSSSRRSASLLWIFFYWFPIHFFRSYSRNC